MIREHEDDLKRRAITGYWRFGGDLTNPPHPDLSRVATSETETVIILKNEGGVLALFRVKPSGKLRRMVRCPKWLRAPGKNSGCSPQACI